jgi:hypothetical protein
LEGKNVPIPPPSPHLDLTLKLMAHARRVLDYEDRGHNERLQAGEDIAEPGPLALNLDEKKQMLETSRWFLSEYIPEQRSSDQGPDTTAALDDLEVSTRETITKLREEISIMEAMEGSKTND